MSHDLESHLAPFGLSQFRRGQREVIETVLAGQDCLCVMPTGGGKSLCYQLPALVLPGVTLVISPLIALMKDQVDTLQARGIAATFINSTLSPEEQSARLEQMVAGEFKLVYVVPERFRSSRFVEAARACGVRLLAVDEAHCVSEWGHDFRPDYARLGRFRAQLGNPPTIALTATATDDVRRDIVELLNLHDPRVYVSGFARENLFYRVQPCSTDRDKDERLISFLDQNPGSGIVYASTRKRCVELAERINTRTGRSTTIYHGGLPPEERRAAQEAFMQGRTEIAVATLAFGMGIDKSDVRFVVHYNLPGSLEAYYQEAGRAGRDGQPAQCLLLFGGGDRHIHEFFIESAYPSRDVVAQVYNYLRALGQNPIEMTQQELKEELKLQIGAEGVGSCEKLLESAGALERLETAENMAAVRLNSDLPTLVDLLPPQAKVRRQVLRAIERRVGGLRYQWHYLQPRELLLELKDFDSTSLNRNLRELATLAAVDYVPPFRGRAIHLSEPARRFDELEIDFDSLERQKTAEYERIENMLRFARTSRCRQQEILKHFGEADAANCGHCDNCDGPAAASPHGQSREASPPVFEAVRIALSGVARATRHDRFFGKQLLAQMLCGSSAKGVVRNRLDKLSTFGLLSQLKQPEVVELLDALLVCGLLEQTEFEPFRPVLQLKPRGVEVMKSPELVPLQIAISEELRAKLEGRPAPPPPPSAGGPERPPLDAGLAERLRKWRDATSRAQNVPAYIVLTNAALDELASARPRSLDALLSIKGIGPTKVRQYGEELLALITGTSAPPPARTTATAVAAKVATPKRELPPEHFGEEFSADDDEAAAAFQASIFDAEDEAPAVAAPTKPASPKAALAAAAPPASVQTMPTPAAPTPAPAVSALSPIANATAPQPTHYWTWRLLAAGLTPEECAAARSLSSEVVLDHALRAADAGHPIDAAWFLTPDVIATIDREIGPGTPTRLRQLLERLPRGTRYEQVQLVLKSRKAPDKPPG